MAGIKITIVPYRGAGPALNDLLGGHIDAMFDAMPVMSVQAKEGKVTPIAVTGTKRSAALPDVPTMQEFGFDLRDDRLVRHPGAARHAAGDRAEAARRGRRRRSRRRTWSRRWRRRAWSRAARSPPNTRNTWHRNWRSTPRSSRTRTSSRNRFDRIAPSSDVDGRPMRRRIRRYSTAHGRAFRLDERIRNSNALSRPLDRSLRRQLPLVERHPHPQGHGALWRRLARGDGPRLRKAARARGRSRIAARPGSRNGARSATRSRSAATRRWPKAARSPPATITCAPASITTTPSASSRPARRRRRSARTPTRSGTRASGCAIRTSSSSRCPMRAPPCPRCS